MLPWIILFKNSFLANFILTIKSEYVYDIMLRLGYNKIIILIITILAAFLAQTINFSIGYAVWQLYNKNILPAKHAKFIKYQKPFTKYLWWSPFVIFLPLWGNLISLTCGLLKYSMKRFLIQIFIGLTLYYSYFII
jgi:membrane protein YqaA with SNARE-associated domain